MTRYAVAILLALTVPASAEDTANEMLPGCKAIFDRDRPAWEQARCTGFIDGLVYGIRGKDFCPPKEATAGQAALVIIKYIEARPERMHEHFGKLSQEALTAAWPCER